MPRPPSALALLVAGMAGCNAISGVGDLAFGDATGGGGAGTTQGAGGSGTSSTATGGAGGAGGSSSATGAGGSTTSTGGGATSTGTSTGSSSSGGGGAGGQACPDADGDGSAVCAGDCDDADPLTHPDATEVCGDAKDNACGNAPDPLGLCQGLGTWVAQGVGDDQNPGTQALPLATIGQGIQNALALGGGADVYVAEGSYAEKIVMVEGVDLLGGHHCDPNGCSWQRDWKAYASTIVTTDAEGVLAGASITRQTRLDGFHVDGLDAALGNGQDARAISVDQGSPTISNSAISGGNVSCAGFCFGRAVRVHGPSNDPEGPLIVDNVIQGGSGPNLVQALGIALQAGAEVRSNVIKGGTSIYGRAVSVMGQAGPTVVIAGNEIHAGSCGAGMNGSSFGASFSGMASVTFEGNRVNADPAQVGSCPGGNAAYWSGGVEAGAITSITNNLIFGLDDAPRSTAVLLGGQEGTVGSITLNGNLLDARGGPGNAAVSAAVALRAGGAGGVNAVVGRIRNNLLIAGKSKNRFALYEDNSPNMHTCRPEALDNNDLWFPPNANSVDAMWREWNGSVGSTLLTIGQVNGHMVDNGAGTAQSNLAVDPMLDATWHLLGGSPCIDAGTSVQAPPTDIDGEPRPQGAAVDIGADEAG